MTYKTFQGHLIYINYKNRLIINHKLLNIYLKKYILTFLTYLKTPYILGYNHIKNKIGEVYG